MKKPLFIFLKIISRFPLWILYRLSDGLFIVIFYLSNYRKKVVEKNLTHAFPAKTPSEIHAIKKKFYRNLADWIIEIIKIPGITKKELRKRCQIIQNNDFESLQNEENGAIILTAHLGNWEWAGHAVGLALDQPVNVVYKNLKNPASNAVMKYIRTFFGNEITAMNETTRKMYRGKAKGLVTCFLADQTPTSKDAGCWPLFMNRPAPFFNGAAKIAQKLDLPVYFGRIKQVRRGHYDITFKKICSNPKNWEANDIIRRYVELLERTLHNQPSNWLWSHRRWKKTGKQPA